MQALRQDLAYALRQLTKHPGFTAAAVLTLALGIGANAAIFSVVNGVLLRPLPYTNGEQLVHIGYRTADSSRDDVLFSVYEVMDYQRQSRTLSAVEEYHSMAFTLLGWGEPDRVQTGVVSAGFFRTLGVKPLLGRTFRPDDEQPGADPVLLLSHDYWQGRFGGDPDIVGRRLEMNGRPIVVVGVLPPLPRYPGEDAIYMTTVGCPIRSAAEVIHNRQVRLVTLFGRLRSGVTLEQARAEVAAISDRLRREYPEVYRDVDADVSVVPVAEELTAEFRPTLLLLLGTVGLVLLIACSNVANLTLTRLISREREVMVRAALGADRGRLARQVLTETTLLSLAGGAVGLLLAAAGTDLLVAFAGRFTARTGEIGIDGRVLLFTLGVSLLTGLVFGVVPALQASRHNLAAALREGGGKGTDGAGRHRFRSGLIVAQVAVSFLLLVTAGLTLRSLLELRRVDPGFNADKVLTLRLTLPFSKYAGEAQIAAFYRRLLARLDEHAGISSVALGNNMPLTGEQISPAFRIEGQSADGEPARGEYHIVSEDYFRTLAIPLLAGRSFTADDDGDAPPVVIVSRSLARRHWPGGDVLGKRIALTGMGAAEEWLTIVGVVADIRQEGLSSNAGAALYLPFLQVTPAGSKLFVRAARDPLSLLAEVRGAVREIDPEQPVDQVRTLADVRLENLAQPRLTAALLGIFACVAFTITALGLSGVLAFSVTQRTREIGIRAALGAGRRRVLGLVLRQGMVLVVIGLALGVLAAMLLVRLASSLLFGVAPTDPLTFVVVSLLLLLVAVMACLVPARRASRIDPMVALRR